MLILWMNNHIRGSSFAEFASLYCHCPILGIKEMLRMMIKTFQTSNVFNLNLFVVMRITNLANRALGFLISHSDI